MEVIVEYNMIVTGVHDKLLHHTDVINSLLLDAEHMRCGTDREHGHAVRKIPMSSVCFLWEDPQTELRSTCSYGVPGPGAGTNQYRHRSPLSRNVTTHS